MCRLCRMDTELVLPETLPEAHAVIRELQAAVRTLRDRLRRTLRRLRQ